MGAFAAVAGVAAANGGYFPTTWGWSALGFLWVAGVALLIRGDWPLCRLESGFLGALVAFASWTALSAAWSGNEGDAVLETERAAVYVSAALATLLVARRRSVSQLLGGALAGIVVVAAYSLATRLFPGHLATFDPVAGYRLSEPLGYWNALAVLISIGVLLAAGFALRARTTLVRALASASLVVLLPTMYFTFSRGAWGALALGLLAAGALERRRLELALPLLAAALIPATAIWLASRSDALTHLDAALPEASHQGRVLAIALTGLAAGAAALAVGVSLARQRVTLGPSSRLAIAAGLAAALVAGVTLVLVRSGGPAGLVTEAKSAFAAAPPRSQADLNDRLFSFSGNGRADLWDVAGSAVEDHPLLGIGAGGYEHFWLEHRPIALKVRDAHSLYLETLAELGPVGLALLSAALALPLVAAARARGHRLVPAAGAAYVAFLVHAGFDWDWEMPAVTLAALLCACAILVAAGRPRSAARGRSLARARAAALCIVLAAFTVVGLVGSSALSASQEAARSADWPKAQAQARKAAGWAPWSAAPWQLLGRAQLARGDSAQAAASFHEAIARDRSGWELWLDLARASEGGEQQRALAEAARLNPLSPELARLRAELAGELLAVPAREA